MLYFGTMLNPFPDLLAYAILAPFMLRMVLGLAFLYAGYRNLTRERQEAASRFRVDWGPLGTFFIWKLGIAQLLVGLALIAGFLTQIAAIVGAVIGVYLFLFKSRYPMIAPRSKLYYVFVVVTSLSLLLTGAGAIAFDLPL